VNLNGEQRELLRKFEESLQEGRGKHAPRGESFFEGVKRFFSSEPS
jgi:molecular chaperone DnaJ